MSRYNDELKLKLAWQSAYEQRTCPDADTLYAEAADENLQKHLSFCEGCREDRTMQQDEKSAWQGLLDKMSASAMQPGSGTAKQEGQVWTLHKSLGRWREDGRYFRPPVVLLLSRSVKSAVWKVAQLYEDKRLMGSGDVPLSDCFGFAEGWNCYLLKEDCFDKCLGGVKQEELQQVLAASVNGHDPAADGSILSFFRNMEIEAGALVAVPAAFEMESALVDIIELLPGLKLVVSGTKEFVLDIAAGTLDLLRGTFRPAMVLRGGASKPAAAKITDEQKKLIEAHCLVVPVELKIVDGTLTVTLKWLRDKPVELPVVRVILNGVDATDAGFTGVTADKVTVKDPSFSALVTSQITALQISLIENVLSLRVSW